MNKKHFLLTAVLGTALALFLLQRKTSDAQEKPHDPPMVTMRDQLSAIYSAELGVQEATGNNDGPQVETYLAYTGLGKGYEWCAAFVSWCYGRAGHNVPRSPWSPALFPANRVIWQRTQENGKSPGKGDVFGIWNNKQQRIAHVGFVDQWQESYLITVEGNSNNTVERRRRPVKSIYQVADWIAPPK